MLKFLSCSLSQGQSLNRLVRQLLRRTQLGRRKDYVIFLLISTGESITNTQTMPGGMASL